ncbi:rRNA-processing protein bfr2 [Coniosporium apollinis]|uniref:Protein BFR2 n=2 Tax=Coniosporium TaxID=2810619 RepID=A0ABQ9NP86_9PEZI|nr:rRNA-processing protein bfr2 [Cladosporium sp. JES 115]KAJ9661581.1 rRNA-processing protein bfr2 [Coniosporium apollinis]
MAKTTRPKTLAEQIAELDDPAPKDFDPEDHGEQAANGTDEGSDDEPPDENDAREHYVDVGKSKLRKRDVVSLGPQYKGSRVSRDAVLEEDSDDPFARGFDEESSEDEDEEGSLNPANGAYAGEDEEASATGSEDDFSGEDEEFDGMSDEDATSATDISDESPDEDDGVDVDGDDGADIDRTELRKIMAEEQKSVAATISQAAQEDAKKGRAVKTQRTTFDSLLNCRIRLQKGLISTNSLPSADSNNETDGSHDGDAVRAAENAALNLLNSLNSLREAIDTARTGTKRKRTEYTTSSSASFIWEQMQSYESVSHPHRQAVLQKWSAKARGASVLPPSRRLNAAAEQTIVDVLDAQLADPSRLVKRTRTPRSCAPVQAAAGVMESADIYDDADFYGLLLKELLEQRSQDATSGVGARLSGINLSVPTWQAAREAKTKRNVDTKASKGRKLRYTVHEKLQNFMAPEDRGTWGERQADELFGSLFGRRVGLAEEEQAGGDEEDVNAEEAELLLFRS